MELELGDIVKHKLTGKRYRVKEIERKGNDYNVICRRLNNENREWEKNHFSDAELEKVADEYREIEYRKREGCDSWHWCRNCSDWPTADFIQTYTKPNGNLCKRCEEKEKVNNCIKL